MVCGKCAGDGGRFPIKYHGDSNKYYCRDCHPMWLGDSPSWLHQKVPHAGTTKLTYAKDEVIKNQRISLDDGVTVVDQRRPNIEAPY